ncbi:hypothetical protein ACFQ48_11175 [Hymenobacter caeli]|uniref:Uncharacterized protein n=1 Tax=Hymenobacter caeli TaxID=2735894 RepID=A0ABX2FRR2_9BACT|nr:hypothetical protein [Hymenobacter caeli]NRT19875.1 hypothetical protein [Hymenobacter caeli]
MRNAIKGLPGLLLVLGIAGFAGGAQAQALPVPGPRNPDWSLEKTEARPTAGPSTALLSNDRMPNAAQQSVSSTGNRHYQWDADRQLAYEWLSRPGSEAPGQSVAVRDERTGTVYTYRRATAPPKSRLWRPIKPIK